MPQSSQSAIALVLCAAAPATAQWTVTNLHPVGANSSYAVAVNGARQVGYTDPTHAGFWTGTAASWVDLNGTGSNTSQGYAIAGSVEGGYYTIQGFQHASLWSGTPGSRVDLHPAGKARSVIYAMNNSQQGGVGVVGVVGHAGLWTGTAASWVDLQPAGVLQSAVLAISSSQQAGYARTGSLNHAALWNGTATSWADLNPAGAGATESTIYAMTETGQAGFASTPAAGMHAGVWSGTAASWVDLNPAGSLESQAYAAAGAFQAGYTSDGSVNHAALWSGSAASWVDLAAFLPAGYSDSYAMGLWTDGSVTYVCGYAMNAGLGRNEAILWTSGAGCYANCDGSTTAPALNVLDFSCFLNRFAAGDAYANCDGSTTPPVLNVLDFSCFLNGFAAGCT